MTWKRFNDLSSRDCPKTALKQLSSRWLNNVKVTHRIIRHCADNGWNYRVSSSLFPLLTHPDFACLFKASVSMVLIYALIAGWSGPTLLTRP